MSSGPHDTLIHTLDNYSLLNVFHLCRPPLLDRDVLDDVRVLRGEEWGHERWWYKIAQVCQRWRYLILGSTSHLDLCLVCTYGTPVADMLAHSPPLPLIIDLAGGHREITTTDEDGILLALQHRDRVRRIRLLIPVLNLQKFIVTMNDDFPMLESLYLGPLAMHYMRLRLPEAFRAPHICHLVLTDFAPPIRSPFLTTATGLLTLSLQKIPRSASVHLGDFLQQLSLMHQLETLGIGFQYPIPKRDVERQISNTPGMAHVTLPNLRWFGFKGTCAYLEALLPWITTPVLKKLQIIFFNQLIFSVPHLRQFMGTTADLRLSSAKIRFFNHMVCLLVFPPEATGVYVLYVEVGCRDLDWQVASAAQIFNTFSTAFSAVEDLTLEYWEHSVPLVRYSGADSIRWCEVLRSFTNVKTLHVHNDLVREISGSLQLDDEESPMELLPKLKEICYSTHDDASNAFAPFINARQNAGHPIILRSIRPVQRSL